MHRSPRRAGLRRAVAALPLAVAGLLAACGDDATDASPTTADDTGIASGGDAVVEVTAVDFAFEGLPGTVAAGTRLTLANDAPSELHELVAVRLPDEETRSVHELLALPPDQLGAVIGAAPPAVVILAEPGGEPILAVGDGTLTEPGRYLVMCSIPTGVAPADYLAAAAASGGEQPQVPGGPPHFAHGMAAELTVE